jgi:hypothetical protein
MNPLPPNHPASKCGKDPFENLVEYIFLSH